MLQLNHRGPNGKNMSSLEDYRQKRDFRKSGEPRGGAKASEGGPLFVIQKHQASRLHYDFRLEVNGVLKSWAVPKGPSTDTSEKRLALPTEDHPLDYADFEGVIPEGQYGAGTVMVWDRGTYRNLQEEKEEPVSMAQSIQEGQVEVWLEGQKIQGGYALIRFRDEDDPQWLLVKMDDAKADARRKPVHTEPDSVLSGRSMEEIAAQEDS